MAAVQQAHNTPGSRIVHIELMGAHGTALHADAEHLGFHCDKHLALIVIHGQNLVQGVLKPGPGAHSVSRNILESVRNPDIHGAGASQLLGKVLGYAHTGLTVVNPEFSDFGILTGQSGILSLWMGEHGGVKIQSQASLLSKFHPICKVSWFQCISVHFFPILENGVAGMKVDSVPARNQVKRLVNIRHKLLGIPGLSRIVSRCLYAA